MNNAVPAWLLLTVLLLLTPSHNVIAEDDALDYIEARQLLDAGQILPLETILAKARKSFPGRMLEVELEKKSGQRIVYEIEILKNDGVVQIVYLDARSGELLFINDK